MLAVAKALVNSHKEVIANAQKLLEEAVSAGNLPTAWKVFQELSEILPKLDWIPYREFSPKVRAFIDEHGDHWERYCFISYLDTLEEPAHMICVGASEEEIFNYTSMTKAYVEDLMWEVLRKGYSGFTNDW